MSEANEEYITVKTTAKHREKTRAKIAADTLQFLANGGSIRQIADGVTGYKLTREFRIS